jgi:hypothetical protein
MMMGNIDYWSEESSTSLSTILNKKIVVSLPSGGICDKLKKNNSKILGIETAKQSS